MTNPIKRLFQILKDLVLLPIRFLQMRRSLQEVESLRQLPRDPKERRKLLARMGILDEMGPMFDPVFDQQRRSHPSNEVDLSYLDEEEEEEEMDEDELES